MKTENAFLVDLRKCTGCMTCTVACKLENALSEGVWWSGVLTVGGAGSDLPLGKYPHTNMCWVPILSTKCTFCAHRRTQGLEPFCVQSCPMKARMFGDMADPNSEISEKMKEIRKKGLVILRLPEFLGTKPSVYYVF
jgi:molybdopterin-containing oxidoreductase family iron-sulfur binding subunit